MPYRDSVFGDDGDEIWHLERGRGAILIGDNGWGMTGWLIFVGFGLIALARREAKERAAETAADATPEPVMS